MTTVQGIFDPELAAALPVGSGPSAPPTVAALRDRLPPADVDALLRDRGVEREDVLIEGSGGAPIALSVLRVVGARAGTRPGIYNIHGGGMVIGDRFTGIGRVLDWISRFDAVGVTIEYRLAPEFPDPIPFEDAYAGWIWMRGHAEELGIDEERLLVAGASAGGGLAAGVCLAARDRGAPLPAGQLLLAPMLDDRMDTPSARAFAEGGTWDRASNLVGWQALLGDRREGADVSVYAAPARAGDLAGLPPAYIDCGGAEIFRDEDVAYANALWRAGVPTELHVWAGGFHSFDAIVPGAALSRAAVETRERWIDRLLA